jgi:hypothetical protein
MSRKVLLIPFVAAAFLAAPAFAPATLPGLSAPAEAATNLNSSRSNIYRKKVVGKQDNIYRTKVIVKSGKSKLGHPHGNARTTTVKSSKSNTSDRVINLNPSRSNRY